MRALGQRREKPAEQIVLRTRAKIVGSEIALKLNQPLGTVKTRTRLGMMKLRDTLRPMLEAR